jgi:hypothetical protein
MASGKRFRLKREMKRAGGEGTSIVEGAGAVERYSPTIFRNPLRILLSNV